MKSNDLKQQFVPHYECRATRVIRWLLTKWRLHQILGLVVPALCLGWGWHSNRPDIFARSGSIMCLIGGLLTFRRHLRGMDNIFFRDTTYAAQPPFGKQIPPHEANASASNTDSTAMRWGIWYVTIGTIVWGYGDLILKSFRICTN